MFPFVQSPETGWTVKVKPLKEHRNTNTYARIEALGLFFSNFGVVCFSGITLLEQYVLKRILLRSEFRNHLYFQVEQTKEK